jgi:hypothetical protein
LNSDASLVAIRAELLYAYRKAWETDMAENVTEWLEAWVEENINSPMYYEEKSVMTNDAKACLAHAQEAGFSAKDVQEAAGGDLEQYLLDRQNELTDSEVNRLVRESD